MKSMRYRFTKMNVAQGIDLAEYLYINMINAMIIRCLGSYTLEEKIANQ